MKRSHSMITTVSIFVLFSISGCGGGGTPSEGEGQISEEQLFYDAAQQVMPTFEVEAASPYLSKDVSTSWEVGNPLYELFYILREFNPDTDQGVIDTSNLYKTLWEAKNFFSNTKSNCTAITEQIITPPFDFGNEATTYNCAYNEEAANGYDFGGALKELDSGGNIIEITDQSREATTAAVKYGLFGFVWVDSGANPHNEYGTLQGLFNDTTDDLSLDIAMWADYDGENDYCYRNDIDGNTTTHEFMFKSIKGNKVTGSNYISVVGKGYSQGEGKYSLLKIAASYLDVSKYYCIAATDGEAELKAMDAAGSDTVDANCAEYQADVDAMVPFGTDNLACATSDFNPGGTGMAAEGTIFLNYQ